MPGSPTSMIAACGWNVVDQRRAPRGRRRPRGTRSPARVSRWHSISRASTLSSTTTIREPFDDRPRRARRRGVVDRARARQRQPDLERAALALAIARAPRACRRASRPATARASSPTPMPPCARSSVRFDCTNSSKIASSMSGAMPTPSSRTRMTASVALGASPRARRGRPRGVYFAALVRRFTQTCWSRDASPSTTSGRRRSSSENARPCASISGRARRDGLLDDRRADRAAVLRSSILFCVTRLASSRSSSSRAI